LSYAIGYFATEEEEHFFQPAIDQVNFFLLLYSLISGQAVAFKTGIGTELKDLDSLGKKDSHFLIMKNPILWGLQRMAFGQDQFTKQKSCLKAFTHKTTNNREPHWARFDLPLHCGSSQSKTIGTSHY
jgi:intracellular septation protein A